MRVHHCTAHTIYCIGRVYVLGLKFWDDRGCSCTVHCFGVFCFTVDLSFAAGYDNQDMEEDVVFDGGFQVPGSIYNRLFDYQKTGTLHLLGPTVGIHAFCSHAQQLIMYQHSCLTHWQSIVHAQSFSRSLHAKFVRIIIPASRTCQSSTARPLCESCSLPLPKTCTCTLGIFQARIPGSSHL